MRSTRSTLPLLLVLAAVAFHPRFVHAQSTWQGGGTDTTWSTAGNWSTTLANGFNTGLVFQGSSGLANTNDLTSGTATSITFNAGAGAFTIGGNAIALTGTIANNSSNLQSIANNITLLASSTVSGTNVTLSGVLTNSGGDRRLTNGLGAGRLLTLGAINLSEGNTSRTFQLSGTGNTTINGPIANGGSGAGNFSAGGTGNVYSGTVTFAGNSTYSGTTTFGSSTLAVVIGSGSAFGTSRVNVNNNNSTNALSASTDVVLSNTVSLNTSLGIAGSSSIELAGVTYFGNPTLSTSVGNSIGAGKSLIISGTLFLQASGSSGNSASATLSGAGNTVLSAPIRNSDTGSGTTSFTISNTGTTTLSGNNSYSGGTTLSGANATFILGHNKAFGDGAVTVSNAIRLQASTELSDIRNAFTLSNILTFSGSNNISLTGTLTHSGGNRTIINGLDAGRQLTLGAINLSENNTGRQLTFTGTGNTSITGAIADGGSGAGSLVFGSSGAAYSGTVTLSASNSYTGGTTVQNANTSLTLVLGDKSALGSGTLNYTNGSFLIRASADLGGSNALSNAVTVATNNLTFDGSNSIGFGSLTNSGNSRQITNNLDKTKTLSFSGTTFLQESGTGVGRTLTVSGSGNTTFSGPIVNGGTGGVSALIIDNTGTTTLSGINTYSGTTRLGNFNSTTTVVIATGSAFGSGVISTGAATSNGGNPVIIATNDVTLANNFHILAGNTSQNTITFGGTNNITLSGIVYSTNQTVEKRINNSIGSSGTLTLSGGINLSHSGARFNNFGGTGNTIVSGSIYQAAGATGSLTLDGSGTTTLSGTNSYTGGTGVSGGGVLVLKSGSALPGGIGTTGGQSSLVVSNGIIGLGAGNFTRGLGTGATQVNLTGTSGFAAFGDNRFVNIGGASGTMTWGATNFTSGPLLLSAAGADGTLDFRNPLALGNTVGTTRTVQVADGSASADAMLSGIVSGSANLEKSGAGTLQLTAANIYTGTTTISAGVLQIGDGNATGSLAGSSEITGSAGATLAFNRNDNYGGNVTNTIGGAIGLSVVGSGTVTLSGNNTYSGGATVLLGQLTLGHANALGTGTTTLSGGALDISTHAPTVGGFTITGGVLTGSGTLTAPTYALGGGEVSSNLGSGTLTVTAASTLAGTSDATALNLNSGTLTLGSGSRFTEVSLAVTGSAGAAVALGGNESFGSLAGAANVALGGNTLSVGAANANTTYSGTLSGAGSLVKQGNGLLVLDRSNAYSGGTVISGGTVRAGTASALGSGALALSAGSFDLYGNTVTVGVLSGSAGTSITSSAGAARLVTSSAADSTFAGVISDGSGPVGFTKAGIGKLTFTGSQGYTGSTIISGGTLALGSGASLAQSIHVRAGAAPGDGGVLDVTALGGGLQVANGQKLGGYGKVVGDVVIANGAIVSPGGSVGTLDIDGTQTWGPGGRYLFEITNANGSTPGTDWDLLMVNALTITATSSPSQFIIDIQTLTNGIDDVAGAMSGANWDPDQSYQWKFLIADTTTFTATNFDASWFTFNTSATIFKNTINGAFSVARGDTVGGASNELYIIYASVPEPGTLSLAGIGVAMAGWSLWKRRRVTKPASLRHDS